MKGSRGLYYKKHRTHTYIRESHKVTKALEIDSVLFMFVITIVSVMTKKINIILTLVVKSNRLRLRYVFYVVHRTKINVASFLSQKIELKDNRSDQQKYCDRC